MREIIFNDHDHGRVIALGAGAILNSEFDTVISTTRDGKLLGGVIYYNFSTCAIWMHVAADDERWVTRDMLWVCFHYPFVQLGCARIFGCVRSNNEPALRFDRKLGFKEITVVPKVYPDADAVIMSMEREDCRFLNMRPRTLAAPD